MPGKKKKRRRRNTKKKKKKNKAVNDVGDIDADECPLAACR